MNSEKAMWLSVLQTFLTDAAKVKSIWNKTKRQQKWNDIWHEANHSGTQGICELVGIEHETFIYRLTKAYQTGKYLEAELDVS